MVLLAADGSARAAGQNDCGQCDLPDLEDNATHAQVAAGAERTALLQSDGTATACGRNDRGQCNVTPLSDGARYARVAAGWWFAIISVSDGGIVICGRNPDGDATRLSCELPNATYAAAALPIMLLQASLESLAVAFRTMSGERLWGTAISTDLTPCRMLWSA